MFLYNFNNNNNNNNNNLFTYIVHVTYADAHTCITVKWYYRSLYNHHNHDNLYNPDYWKYSIYNLSNFYNH